LAGKCRSLALQDLAGKCNNSLFTPLQFETEDRANIKFAVWRGFARFTQVHELNSNSNEKALEFGREMQFLGEFYRKNYFNSSLLILSA
jgi:hypothetical protein